jgi:hypothetical protein
MDRPSLRRLIWRLQRDNGKVCKRLTAQGISPLFSRWSAEYAGQYCRLRLFFWGAGRWKPARSLQREFSRSHADATLFRYDFIPPAFFKKGIFAIKIFTRRAVIECNAR